MHAQEVFISNKIYKKSVMFYKLVIKKLFSLQKLFEMHYSLKKLSASPKNGNPPQINNNGPSLRILTHFLAKTIVNITNSIQL